MNRATSFERLYYDAEKRMPTNKRVIEEFPSISVPQIREAIKDLHIEEPQESKLQREFLSD
jgi:hypothetical protein